MNGRKKFQKTVLWTSPNVFLRNCSLIEPFFGKEKLKFVPFSTPPLMEYNSMGLDFTLIAPAVLTGVILLFILYSVLTDNKAIGALIQLGSILSDSLILTY